jgi:broad specificity phosphatase PhoE
MYQIGVSNTQKKSNIARMNVYLFRHGQKGFSPLAEPDLTDDGHKQAAVIAERIRSGTFLPGTQFLVSPRLRAQSTLRPAALFCKVTPKIAKALDQREGFESTEQFRSRIADFIRTLEKSYTKTDTVYLCTHHDWIEEALSLIPADIDLLDSKYWSWSSAQFAQFKVTNGLWELKSFDKILP